MDVVEIATEDAGSSHDHDPNLVSFTVPLDAVISIELDYANTAIGNWKTDRPEMSVTIRIGHGVDA
jgi:hypothetical protein